MPEIRQEIRQDEINYAMDIVDAAKTEQKKVILKIKTDEYEDIDVYPSREEEDTIVIHLTLNEAITILDSSVISQFLSQLLEEKANEETVESINEKWMEKATEKYEINKPKCW